LARKKENLRNESKVSFSDQHFRCCGKKLHCKVLHGRSEEN